MRISIGAYVRIALRYKTKSAGTYTQDYMNEWM